MSPFVRGQNLVMNPSFEDTIPCIVYQNIGPPQLPCTYWFCATNGSVDYFSHLCNDVTYGTPQNSLGFQIAKTGTAYCGIGLWNIPTPISNYREYLEGQLFDTLKQGRTYCVSFYVVNTDSCIYYTPNIGVYFSNDSLVDYNSNSTLPVAPQIVNTNGFIYDTLNWIQISGNYIAGGGEKYFIIGNFNDDSNTLLDSNSNTNMFYGVAYFYIDDVSVVDCTVGINEIESYKNKIKLMPNPAKDELRIMSDESGIKKIEVCDVLNNVMLAESAEAKEKSITINVSNFASGTYFIKVFNNKGIAVKKFVKE